MNCSTTGQGKILCPLFKPLILITMNKKLFLAFLILVIVAISAVATAYPVATFGIAVCSLPFVAAACYLTTPDKLKDKKTK